MTAEQKQYSDFVCSLNRDALLEETMHMIMLAAADSDVSTEYHWKRRACRSEWLHRDGNDNRYALALAEAAVNVDGE
jgi:hypothetical protein